MTSLSTSRVCSCGSKNKPSLTVNLAAVVVASLVISKPSLAEWYGGKEAHMGTEVTVYLWHDDNVTGQDAVNSVFK